MNERIRELVVKLVPDAFMTYKGYLYHSSDPKVFEHSDPEPLYTKQELVKFAELIVRECLNEIESQRSNGENDDQWTITRDLCYHNMMAQLKQHFGVK